jgi:hypothetical protein
VVWPFSLAANCRKASVSTANFKLLGIATPLEPTVQIAWMEDSGRAGLRFTDMLKDSREQLDTWLASQGEKNDKGYD